MWTICTYIFNIKNRKIDYRIFAKDRWICGGLNDWKEWRCEARTPCVQGSVCVFRLGWNTICTLYVGAVVRNANAIESVAGPVTVVWRTYADYIQIGISVSRATREEYFTPHRFSSRRVQTELPPMFKLPLNALVCFSSRIDKKRDSLVSSGLKIRINLNLNNWLYYHCVRSRQSRFNCLILNNIMK